MKDFLLSFVTIPGVIIIVYLLGLLTNNTKKKAKIFSIGLLIMLVFSLPIFSKIISYPLIHLPKYFFTDTIRNVKSLVILTGGIYKNTINQWKPSRNTEKRVFLAKKILSEYKLPVLISGGFTKPNGPSEAELTRNYYNLSGSIVDNSSLNTYQSALNLKKYCLSLNGPLMIVTDSYHSLRSYLSFKSQGCDALIYDYDFKITLKDIMPSMYGFSSFNRTIYEYAGILYYITTLKINLLNLI